MRFRTVLSCKVTAICFKNDLFQKKNCEKSRFYDFIIRFESASIQTFYCHQVPHPPSARRPLAMDGADPDALEPISRLSSEKSLKLQKFLKNNLQRKKVAEIS